MADRSFTQRLEGLLSGSSPIGNFGLGLLANSGPVPQGTRSTGQVIANAAQFASQRQQEAMRNDAMREELAARQRRQKALQQLPGLLGQSSVVQGQGRDVQGVGGESIGSIPGRQAMVPRAATPQGQQQLMGLLSQANPEAFTQAMTQGLLGQQQERAEPAPVRIARILADPNESQEVKDGILQQIESTDQGEQLSNMLKTLQIQQLQQERQQARTESERGKIDARLSVLNSDQALREAAQINNRLRGTVQETGLGMNDLRSRAAGPLSAFAGLFGGDSDRARQVAADVQRFEQLTTREAVQSLFSGQVGGGTLTNQKLETFLATKPGVSRLPETNNKILADMLQTNLDSASKLGIELPDRSRTEALISQLRADDFGSTEPNAPDAPSAVQNAGARAREVGAAASQQGQAAIRSVKTLLNGLTTDAVEAGGRVGNASREAVQRAGSEIDALRGSISDEDIQRAKDLVSQGTEESLLAARGLLDRAAEASQRGAQSARRAGARVSEIARMRLEQLRQLDPAELSQEALEAATRRFEELSGAD